MSTEADLRRLVSLYQSIPKGEPCQRLPDLVKVMARPTPWGAIRGFGARAWRRRRRR